MEIKFLFEVERNWAVSNLLTDENQALNSQKMERIRKQ